MEAFMAFVVLVAIASILINFFLASQIDAAKGYIEHWRDRYEQISDSQFTQFKKLISEISTLKAKNRLLEKKIEAAFAALDNEGEDE